MANCNCCTPHAASFYARPLVFDCCGDVARLPTAGTLKVSNIESSGTLLIAPGLASPLQMDRLGNLRGASAVDLQNSRTVDTQVASGISSAILGGKQNTAAAINCTITGGQTNSIDSASNDSSISGGKDNVVIGSLRCAICGGRDNTIEMDAAANDYCTIAGGNVNTIYDSVAATIVGGQQNTIDTVSTMATIAGGFTNTIDDSIYAMIGGGRLHDITDSSDYSSIVSGYDNNIDASLYACIVGGRTNTITSGGTYSSILAGLNNSISSTYATCTGRNCTVLTGDTYAHASGYYAITSAIAERAHGAGRHDTTAGSAQASEFVLWTTTTDDSWDDLATNGTTTNLVVPANGCWTYEAIITGQKTDGSQGAGYILRGCVRRDGNGAATAVGVAPTGGGIILGEDDAAWDAQVVFASSLIKFQVKGAVATDINWTASVRVAQTIVES